MALPVQILEGVTPHVEVYSIDECFLRLPAEPGVALATAARIRERVATWIGLPVQIGIGSRLTARLAPLGIRTTLDLARADPRQMRRLFSVVVERTVRELRGVPCLEFGPAPPVRRELMHGRMLGQPVTSWA